MEFWCDLKADPAVSSFAVLGSQLLVEHQPRPQSAHYLLDTLVSEPRAPNINQVLELGKRTHALVAKRSPCSTHFFFEEAARPEYHEFND